MAVVTQVVLEQGSVRLQCGPGPTALACAFALLKVRSGVLRLSLLVCCDHSRSCDQLLQRSTACATQPGGAQVLITSTCVGALMGLGR